MQKKLLTKIYVFMNKGKYWTTQASSFYWTDAPLLKQLISSCHSQGLKPYCFYLSYSQGLVSETQLYQKHGTDTRWPRSTQIYSHNVFMGGLIWPLCCDFLIWESDNKEEGLLCMCLWSLPFSYRQLPRRRLNIRKVPGQHLGLFDKADCNNLK